MMEAVGEALRSASAQAVLPRFGALQPAETEMKAANEPVTVADREAEAILNEALAVLLPGARIVGEEACAARPELIDRLDDGVVWIIDPIDGTANFAAGRPPFAMMVALLKEGVAIASWILDPLSGRLAVTELGAGAWIDGKRVTAATDSPALAELCGIVSEAFVPVAQKPLIGALRMGVQSVVPTARCAGHEYPLVAAGERDFALYWRTLAWDHAPGALLLGEAGGAVVHLDGSPYRPARPRPGLVLARNPLIANTLLGLVNKGAR